MPLRNELLLDQMRRLSKDLYSLKPVLLCATFSWIIINLNLNANHVTALFFIIGFIGSFLFLSMNPYVSIIAFLFWRLHIIFDICDGEVARFNQKFSINGAYWDYMIHAVLYPLYFINIGISQYFLFGDVVFLFLGIFGGLMLSLQQAV